MKKWSVLAIVLVLGAVMVLQYILKKNAAVVAPTAGEADAPEVAGVALPADGRVPVPAHPAPDIPVLVSNREAPSTYGPLPTFAGEASRKGECKDGSLNDILSAHGRLWGHYPNTIAFEAPQTQQIYSLISRYFACVSLARRDASACNYLPAAGAVGGRKISFDSSPNFACREGYAEIAFAGFMAGKSKDDSPCRVMVANGAIEGDSMSAADFCAAAGKGVSGFCASLTKSVDSKEMKECLAYFPPSLESCRGDSKCLKRFELFGALESASPGACPAENADFCRAYFSGTDSACAGVLKELSGTYCKILAKRVKDTGGTLGLTKAEAAIHAGRKKESDETLELVNKRIRELKKSNLTIKGVSPKKKESGGETDPNTTKTGNGK